MADAIQDVIVVGAGIVGLTVADVLLQRGHSVTVLERARVGDGTSGRSTGKATLLQGARYQRLAAGPGPDVARCYGEAQAAALEHIVRNAGGDAAWFDRCAAVTYATTASGRSELEVEREAAHRAGLDVRLDDEAGLPFATTGALVLEGRGQLDPRGYLAELAGRVRGHPNGSLHEGSPVRSVEVGHHPSVELDDGRISAQSVVLASLLPISERGLTSMRTSPHMSHCVALELEGRAPAGMFQSVDHPARSIRRATVNDVNCLVVGGEGHRVGDPPDDDAHAILTRWAQDHLPVGDMVERWSTHDHQPHRGRPMAGRIRPGEAVWFATGFGGWGMTNGTAAGLVIADQVAGVSPASPRWHAMFDPSARDLRELAASLRPNVEVGMRFGAGHLRASGPTCSHLGGRCRWNDLDASWDCPLHGSRFGPSGEVLVAPATRPITVPEGPGSR